MRAFGDITALFSQMNCLTRMRGDVSVSCWKIPPFRNIKK